MVNAMKNAHHFITMSKENVSLVVLIVNLVMDKNVNNAKLLIYFKTKNVKKIVILDFIYKKIHVCHVKEVVNNVMRKNVQNVLMVYS